MLKYISGYIKVYEEHKVTTTCFKITSTFCPIFYAEITECRTYLSDSDLHRCIECTYRIKTCFSVSFVEIECRDLFVVAYNS